MELSAQDAAKIASEPSTSPAPVATTGKPDEKPLGKPAEGSSEEKPGDTPGRPGSERRKPSEGPGKPGETPGKPGEPTAPTTPATIQRPPVPAQPPRPEELLIRPDAQGKVRFNFRGQPWPDVLSWLAGISEQSLDWQELPGDFLNLTTQRSYTVEEARDLINRHLLARGYSILESGEILNVVNLKKLDPGMVPRIEPQELAKRQPHEFVKVSFPLDWLVAESAVEELKPMLSPFGKLTSLKATNRLEAIDAVVNLRSIYRVIGQEQATDGQERMVREFELIHAKAAEVHQQLQKLMGVEEKSSSAMSMGRGDGGQSREQMEMMMRQQAEMMSQDGGRGGRGMPTPNKPKVEISLVVNARRNTVLALAPPDKMAVITQAVKMLDVAANQTPTLMGALQRVQVFRLASLDPAVLLKMLEESGGLEPTTRLQADDKNKALIVHGSLADQITIRAMIEKLDGASRKFQVIPLRRLEADYVAGTIEFMMGATPEEPPQNSRRGYFDFSDSRRGQQQEKERDKFRVDADVENNRLLVWANEIELKEVTNLLIKLGEIPDRNGGEGTLRMLPLPEGADSGQFLEQLRRVWPSLAPNPLLMRGEPSNALPRSSDKTTPRGGVREEKPAQPKKEPSDSSSLPATDQPKSKSQPKSSLRTAANGRPVEIALADETEPTEPITKPTVAAPPDDTDNSPPTAAPVLVTVTPQGKIMLSSADPRALDLLEEVITQLTATERKEFQVFKLQHSQAYWVRLTIEKYFEEEEKDKNSRSRNFFFYDSAPTKAAEPKHRLSKRRKLKFISDPDTNTILVAGADPSQLKTIAELIELYDQPVATDSKAARVTVMYPVRWSTPTLIAETLKEVYRDLLSSNDKALSQSPDQRRPQNQTNYIFGEGGDSEEKRTPVSFKGKLSLGIDETSNTLIISADGEALMQNVLKMVKSLDESAKPAESVQVLRLDSGANPEAIRRVISQVFGDSTKSRPAANTPQPDSSTQQRQRAGNRQRQ